MKVIVVAVIAVFAMIFVMGVQPGQAVSCDQVDVALGQCIPYLNRKTENPSSACCKGVEAVKDMAQTSADKRATCSCVKAAAMQVTDLSDAAALNLAPKCGVTLDIPVSRTVDCDKLNQGHGGQTNN